MTRGKPELPLNKVVEAEQAQRLPLLGHAELTLRDEANAMTAWAFRDGGLQDIGPEAAPGFVPRISNAEMKHLLVATSARLAHWLAVRDCYVGESPVVKGRWTLRNAFFKTERFRGVEQINIGLGRGNALELFNLNIRSSRVLGKQ